MQKIRKKVGEELTPSNIKNVISLLTREINPISKKEACEILNISYNTTRLSKIIDDFKEREVYAEGRRKQNRLKPISDYEVKEIIESYLAGDSLSDISNSIYRSIPIIKRVLARYNIPLKNASYSYFNPVFLENESMIADNYRIGDLVFSARYNCAAIIENIYLTKDKPTAYKLWLYGDYNQWAMQPYYELSDLREAQKLGIKFPDYTKEEIMELIVEGLKKAKRISDDK